MQFRRAGVVAIWVVALGAAITVLLTVAAEDRLAGFSLALAACVVLSFIVQLSVPEKRGFVTRLMASSVGAFLIMLVASIIGSVTA